MNDIADCWSVMYKYTGYHKAVYNRGRPGGKNFDVKPTEVSAS